MASISREKNGRRTIQFVGPDGKRRSIRLGKVSQRVAEAVKVRVEHLAAAAITGHALDAETARWVAELSDSLADKLAKVGLIAERESATLGEFVDGYIGKHTDVKPRTLLAYKQGRDSLVEFFGADRRLDTISPGEADEYRLWLRGEANKGDGYAEATTGRRIKHAKQFFTAAVRRRVIQGNPFADVKGGTQENRDRFYFVTREEIAKVIDACPNVEWRLLVALARYGGLRIPSEVVRLRWQDVDWSHGRLTVHAPKTEHHKGKGTRQIPLFPELRPYLSAAFDAAEPGAVYLVPSVRSKEKNLRTRLERIIYRAGLLPWPKLWQNLRSTRETELTERFPLHVVCEWIGNSAPVAAKHYLQVTDEHYRQAAETESGAESGARAVQNPVQQPAATLRKPSQRKPQPQAGSGFVRILATPCDSVQNAIVGPEGVEPPTQGL